MLLFLPLKQEEFCFVVAVPTLPLGQSNAAMMIMEVEDEKSSERCRLFCFLSHFKCVVKLFYWVCSRSACVCCWQLGLSILFERLFGMGSIIELSYDRVYCMICIYRWVLRAGSVVTSVDVN
jgi:hypothetical protein